MGCEAAQCRGTLCEEKIHQELPAALLNGGSGGARIGPSGTQGSNFTWGKKKRKEHFHGLGRLQAGFSKSLPMAVFLQLEKPVWTVLATAQLQNLVIQEFKEAVSHTHFHESHEDAGYSLTLDTHGSPAQLIAPGLQIRKDHRVVPLVPLSTQKARFSTHTASSTFRQEQTAKPQWVTCRFPQVLLIL
jgi:hypothetical protein